MTTTIEELRRDRTDRDNAGMSDDWLLVVSYMGLSGVRRDELTWDEMWSVYCLGDGFGKMTSEQLRTINGGWDWSHVRDSSPAAVKAMAKRISEIVDSRPLVMMSEEGTYGGWSFTVEAPKGGRLVLDEAHARRLYRELATSLAEMDD